MMKAIKVLFVVVFISGCSSFIHHQKDSGNKSVSLNPAKDRGRVNLSHLC